MKYLKGLILFSGSNCNTAKILEVANIKNGFKTTVSVWDNIVVGSVEDDFSGNKEIVIGYTEKYKDMIDIFIDEEYFEKSVNFNIIQETDINLSQRIQYYCYDKNDNLVFTKTQYFPKFKVEWDRIVNYSNKRRLKIFNFFDNIEE